jgi:hypothetical protein
MWQILKHTLALTVIYTLIWLVCFEYPHNPQKAIEGWVALLVGSFFGACMMGPIEKSRKIRPLRWEFSRPPFCLRVRKALPKNSSW